MALLNTLFGGWSVLVFLFFYLPIVFLVIFSFNSSRLNVVWEGFTLRWYQELWDNTRLINGLKASLIVASISTVLAVILGTSSAWLLHRYRYAGRRVISTAAHLPMVVPEIIMGISLLVFFKSIDFGLGFTTVILAHTTFCFPFVMAAIQARLAGIDPSLEEAALDLGASPLKAFWHVIVPYLMPAISSGALMAFALSMDELIVTYFVKSASSATLPVVIFDRVKKGLDPMINALSTIFILFTVLLLLLSEWVKNGAPLIAGTVTDTFFSMKKYLRSLVAVGATCVGAAALSAAELNLFAWSEYVPQTVLDKFTEETGIKVNYETYASNEEMLSKLVGGSEYDLIQPSEYVIEVMVKRGMLEPIDFAAVPNMKNLGKEFLKLPHDPEQKFSVPYMVGSVGIVVNTEKIKEPIKGYSDVFSGKYAGRIVTLDDNREILSWALESLGADINKIDATSMEKARPVLKKWLPQIKLYDSDSPKTAFLNGEVDIGIVWSGEAAILHKEDKKFAYVLPAEGGHLFIDSLAIPKGAPHKKEAEKFINFILRPDISALISEEFPYTNPNLAAREKLTPEQRDNPASYPKDASRLKTFRDIGKAAGDVDKLITDLRGDA